jgi:hypothetical protein
MSRIVDRAARLPIQRLSANCQYGAGREGRVIQPRRGESVRIGHADAISRLTSLSAGADPRA